MLEICVRKKQTTLTAQTTHGLGNLASEDVALEQVGVVEGFNEAEATSQVVFSLGAQYERIEGKLLDLIPSVAQRVQEPLKKLNSEKLHV